jgi:hypothetical protein
MNLRRELLNDFVALPEPNILMTAPPDRQFRHSAAQRCPRWLPARSDSYLSWMKLKIFSLPSPIVRYG